MAAKSEDFVYFILVNPSVPSYGFATYTDSKGDVKFIESRKDKNNDPIPRRFKFTQSQRTLRVHKDKEHIISFLRNHPLCEGSPNANNKPPMFKEMNQGKDAQVGIDAMTNSVKAQTAALELEGAELKSVGALCGSFADSEEILKYHVMRYAASDPDTFMAHYTSVKNKGGDGHIRALIKKGLTPDVNVLTKKGTVIYWNDEMLGADEDEAVGKISKTKGMKEALSKAING